jgi:hypothetical protein
MRAASHKSVAATLLALQRHAGCLRMDAMQQSRQSCPARLLPLPSCPLALLSLVLLSSGACWTRVACSSPKPLFTHDAPIKPAIRTLTLSSWPWRPHTTSSPRPTRVRDASPLTRENQHKTYIAALSAQSSTIPPASAPGQRASRAALMVPRADAMTGSDPLDDLIRLSISGASDVIGMQRARRPRSRQRHPSALASRTRALVELSHIQFLVIPALTVCVCSCAHETSHSAHNSNTLGHHGGATCPVAAHCSAGCALHVGCYRNHRCAPVLRRAA